jgi:tetratricopeptide (TPR) repeat protein
MHKQDVKAWIEDIVIPTYPVGVPEKNPMFLEKRIYQGSSGVVYPYPVVEKIHDEKIDQVYKAVFLENRYLKVMILPELGGRIQMAYDKVMQRHFVYYNRVIKPALVGLTGPWISGGIEFNWPQHHRPSTFEPLDFTIIDNENGSVTVWVNEVERMFRTKGMAGFTLYPDKAFIEIQGKLYNRTPFPQTFLWWANPAVKVNDDYQSVFPPDVHAVFDHGKRDVSSFPVAKGVYYKVDYSPGTDISKYKNIPVPTSFMAVSSKYNFIGGYEHDTKGGLLHVADHHIAPGKKQWTWGNGKFGRKWDENLTDEDGPYIELMTGVYTDNQPDFTWIQPYEEKTFVQYFMPYREVGMVKNATKEAMVNLTVSDLEVEIRLYVTSSYENLTVEILSGATCLFRDSISSSPESPYVKKVILKEALRPEEIRLIVTDLNSGKELVSYQEEPYTEPPIPSAAQPAKRPADVENNEQLFLTGMHLEQYRHATYSASDYYEEALRRDPKDARSNNALGLWYLRRGQFARAEAFFKKAIETITQRNPNPYDGEPYYNLGWALTLQNKNDEAFDAFYKAIWNDAWQHAGFLNLARIATLRKDYEEALAFIEKALVKNYHSHTARHANTFILRKLNRNREAAALIDASLELDPFNFGCLFEKYLLQAPAGEGKANDVLAHLRTLSRNNANNFIEYAFDYAHAGLYEEAIQLLSIYRTHNDQNTLVEYYFSWFTYQSGNHQLGKEYFQRASSLAPDFVFPNKTEDVAIFQKAIELNPNDGKAFYYLGNFWFDKRQYKEAVESWEQAVQIDNNLPTAHRNLSLAYYNKLNDPARALESMEKAFSLDDTDARVLMELDQLYKRLNRDYKERLQLLEKYLPLVEKRNDLYLERITLYNQLGEHRKAKNLLTSYKFHPWEGGEGKVIAQYLICNVELAKQLITEGDYDTALGLLSEAENYPPNLGEEKLVSVQENDIHYWKGFVYEKSGNNEMAHQYYTMATKGISEPTQAIFYNDPQPDKIFYQGLAWRKLKDPSRSHNLFKRLVDYGLSHMEDEISIDYFAVSLPDLLVFNVDLNLRNRIHCFYIMALGNLGLGKEHMLQAEKYFNQILELDKNHQGTLIHKRMIKTENMN